MAICDSEFWITADWTPGYVHECPCYSDERSVFYCGLGVFEAHDNYTMVPDKRPATCPHAPALKAVLENPDGELAFIAYTCGQCQKFFTCDNKPDPRWIPMDIACEEFAKGGSDDELDI